MSNQGESTGRGRSRGPRRPVRRVLIAAVGLLIVAGLMWPALWGEPGHGVAKVRASESTAADGASRVDVIRPTRGGVRRVTMQPGSVHAFESVELFAKVSGFLKTQAVDIGSAVKKGQVLAEIDSPELLKDVEKATAEVEQARAQAEQAEARIETAEAEDRAARAAVDQAEADIARLVANRSLQSKQFERIKDLHARNAIDKRLVDEEQQQYESSLAAEQTGHAAVRTARAQAATATAKVRQAKADLAEARTTIRVAESRRERATVMADYARIVAPFDGVVTHRQFHPGAFIRSAADGVPEALLTVRRTDLLRVVVQVPDLDVPLLDVGDRATVVIDALKGRELAASVARLGGAEDPTTRTMRVEIDLPNPDGRLYPGMYGRVTIDLRPPTDHLTIPAACVVGHADRGRAAVFVARAGKATRRTVTLGDDDGAAVEILDGLKPDDAVILRPAATLDDGASIVAAGGSTTK